MWWFLIDRFLVKLVIVSLGGSDRYRQYWVVWTMLCIHCSGKFPLYQIRLLPHDLPHVEYDTSNVIPVGRRRRSAVPETPPIMTTPPNRSRMSRGSIAKYVYFSNSWVLGVWEQWCCWSYTVSYLLSPQITGGGHGKELCSLDVLASEQQMIALVRLQKDVSILLVLLKLCLFDRCRMRWAYRYRQIDRQHTASCDVIIL